MNRKWLQLAVPIVCAAVALSACNPANKGTPAAPGRSTTQAVPGPTQQGTTTPLHSASVIPSYNSEKIRTTNQYGTTYSGMGTNVYSRIGSSGLHNAGISSNIESRLNSAGVHGISVLVLDDTVVLGEAGTHAHSAGYDPMQSKLLSPYSGTSGTGPKNTSGKAGSTGTRGTSNQSTLERARHEVESMVGGTGRVLTITNKHAVKAMQRVKSALSAKSSAYKTLSSDISTIMKHASGKSAKAAPRQATTKQTAKHPAKHAGTR